MSRIGLLGTEVFGARSPGLVRGGREARGSAEWSPAVPEPHVAEPFVPQLPVLEAPAPPPPSLRTLQRTPGRDADPYMTWGPTVREGLLGLMARPSPSVEARLSAFMDLCDRLSGYFHENATHVDREQLLGELEGGLAPRSRLPSAWADTMAVRLARFYLETYRPDPRDRLGRLVVRVRAGYRRRWQLLPNAGLTEAEALAACHQGRAESCAADVDSARGEHLEIDVVLRRYRSRRALVLLGHGRRIEHWFSSHCLNYLLVESYQDWPDLRAYARDLALRVASVRFLLFSHPALVASCDAGGEGPESLELEGEVWSAETLESAASETFQCVARACEGQGLLDALRKATRVDEVPSAAALCGLVTL